MKYFELWQHIFEITVLLFLTEESKTLLMSVNKLRKKCFRIYVQRYSQDPILQRKLLWKMKQLCGHSTIIIYNFRAQMARILHYVQL